MSVKQDRVAARTVTDLERKYSFGKTFAEMQGLIDDSRDRVAEIEDKVDSMSGDSSTSVGRNEFEVWAKAERSYTDSAVAGARAYTDSEVGRVEGDVSEVKQSVETKLDADQFSIKVQKELSSGVTLESGYAFTNDGLNISKSGDLMANKLDNTGMFVTRSGDEILTADQYGVTATDLHAKTFLKVGSEDGRSRFEDYGLDRIGCFWIGG